MNLLRGGLSRDRSPEQHKQFHENKFFTEVQVETQGRIIRMDLPGRIFSAFCSELKIEPESLWSKSSTNVRDVEAKLDPPQPRSRALIIGVVLFPFKMT
jgi:hypothetical protein